MEKAKTDWLGYLHWVIGVAIMCLGYVIPASEPLTPMGVRVLMVFVGMIYLWCTVNPIGSSLLALFMVSVVGYAPFTEVIAVAISNQTWTLVFFSCILLMAAIESGMPKYISHSIFKATQGIVTGRPMMLIFVIMCVAFIISMLTAIVPTILMLWAICYAIIDDLKLEKTDRYSMLLVMSSFMGAMLGSAALPFKGATIIIISAFEQASGMKMPYGPYIVINLVCSIVIMIAFCVLVKYLFRIDLHKVKNIDGRMMAKEELPPMNAGVKANLFATFAFITLTMASSFLPVGTAAHTFLNNLGIEGISIVMIVFLFIIQGRGKNVIKLNKVMEKMPWPAVFMVMAAVYMAGAMKNKDVTGIIPWLKTVLNPILGGHSEFIFAAMIFALAMILTCFFHNGALGNMMMPILFAVSDASGYHSVAIAAIVAIAINVAFLAPSASNYAPLLHGNKDYISMKDIWTYGLFFELLAFAVFLLLGLPMAKIMM